MTDGYKIKRVLIRPNGTEKQVYPAKWKPGVNTYIYYPLTSNLVDQMGNGNTGTMTGTCTFDSSTGIHVTGRSGNYVTGLSNGINNRSVFTVNVWCKFETSTSASFLLGKSTSSASSQALWLNVYSQIQLGVCYGSSFQEGKINYDSNWHNACMTLNGTTFNVYFDGTNVLSTTAGTPNNYGEMQIGWGGDYGSGRSCDGYIKDYIVETVARTAEEISDYYNQTKSNYGL